MEILDQCALLTGLPAFAEAFHPKKYFVVGTGGISLEDFLKCDIETLIG